MAKLGQQRKVALITGGAKGLGKMVTIMLASLGHDIVLNYRYSGAEAAKLKQDIEALGVRCLTIQADISRIDDVQRLVRTVNREVGAADIVINNAGPFRRERCLFADYTEEEILYLLHGNLTGVMLLDHLLLGSMRRKKWGRIIHFGFSHAGEARSWPHRAVYAAAKVGLVSFTKTLAVEEAPHGITVNMICPGDIRGVHKESCIAEVRDEKDEETPRGRPGTGEDVTRVVHFLCKERSDFITGNIIDVSGGLDPIRTNIGSFP